MKGSKYYQTELSFRESGKNRTSCEANVSMLTAANMMVSGPKVSQKVSESRLGQIRNAMKVSGYKEGQ